MLTLSIVIAAFIAGALIAYIVSLTSKNKRLLEESERLRQDTDSKQHIKSWRSAIFQFEHMTWLFLSWLKRV